VKDHAIVEVLTESIYEIGLIWKATFFYFVRLPELSFKLFDMLRFLSQLAIRLQIYYKPGIFSPWHACFNLGI